MKKGLLFRIRLWSGLVLICLLTSASVVSQQRMTIKGTVVDASNLPIPGASVVIKNTTTGEITNAMGEFTFASVAQAPSVELQISFLGYRTTEVTAYPNVDNRYVLEEDATILDDIVVTGYGDFSKATYTGAASVVNIDKLKDIPAVSASQLLEAQVPGLSITTSSGQSGSYQNMRIRGQGSVNASSSPLYVLDGVPILSGSMSSNSNTSSVGFDPLATINPSDIESITVLKDATSTSLYGARGSNGVILITTKKGTEGKTSVTFRASTSISDFAIDYRPIMGGEERRELIYEGFVNNRLERNFTLQEAMEYADSQIDIYAPVPEGGYSDWRDALFSKGHGQNYDLSVSSGTKNTRFSATLGYTNEDGVTLSSGFERYNASINLNHNYQNFDFNINMRYSYTDSKATPEAAWYAGSIYPALISLTPSTPIYNSDGTYAMDWSSGNNNGYNPLHEDAHTISYNRINRFIGSVGIGYKIIDQLKLSTTLNLEQLSRREFRFWSPEAKDGRTANGSANLYTPNSLVYQTQTTLSYNQSFGKHHVTANGTFELRDNQFHYNYALKENYGYWGDPAMSNATIPKTISEYMQKDRLVALVAQANYDYDNRFYFAATYRRDASSRLSPDARWGNFWSVSGSWRLSQEQFMKPVSNWLSDLKIKASYGVNGNLPDNWYAWHGLFAASGQYGEFPALYENTLANNKLTWEDGYTTNIGIDATFLGRINVELNLYQRDSKNLLFQNPVFNATGFATVWDNLGHMRNRGIEFESNSVNMEKKDFRWTSALNLYHNKSKILKLGSEGTPIIDGRRIRMEGEAWTTIYVLEYAGVDPQTGKALYYTNKPITDQAGNVTLSRDVTTTPDNAIADRIPWKDAEPTLRGGFTNTFRYKLIDLSFHLSFSLGGWIADNNLWNMQDDGYNQSLNKSTELRRRWKEPGDVTDVPRYVSGYSYGGWFTSTRAVHSADHLRLKNLSLGVRAPKKWMDAIGLNSGRIYFSGSNLFTWASCDFLEPEIWGQQGLAIPPLKTYSFGIELTF